MTERTAFAILLGSIVVAIVGSVLATNIFSKPIEVSLQLPEQSAELGSFYEDYPVHFGKGLFGGITKEFEVDENGDVTTSGFTQGGGVLNVIDANGGTYSLTEAQLLEYNVLELNAGGPGQAVIDLTLPASSTLNELIPNPGDMREYIIDASALSAATTTTITAGTGIDLISVTTADDVIDGGEYARLTIWRKENTNIGAITSELLNSD